MINSDVVSVQEEPKNYMGLVEISEYSGVGASGLPDDFWSWN